ncbi:hypothetical protein [Alteromonas sp. C1M14]|uniref:hypothetical protein n=1 Tax=Alteromonas sp. C1M14 TaxID=2841567 RepID=UPI001C08E62B|nr:hypothetical protein [Alteromonas sp. C1M14]MBU2980037.1 hypothetical protein [Alteromonas sp. C1M14]
MEILFVKYLHLLCLVYWLGGDLGTFIAGRFVINEKLSASARVVATKILLACDQGPRFAMPLTLPSGMQLAYLMGVFAVPVWFMFVVWLLGLGWLATLMALHFTTAQAKGPLTLLDGLLRKSVCFSCLGYGIYSLIFTTSLTVNWAGYKLTLFGVTVLMGLIIRVKLKPFLAVYGDLVADRVSGETNQAIKQGIDGATPYVKVIWLVLFINTAIGLHILA